MITDDTLHLAIRIGSAGLVLALAGVCLLYYVYDRQKARYIKHQTIMSLYLKKALYDRNDKARIPADQLAKMFEIDTRTIAVFEQVPREHKHPALLTPARRVKL